MSHAFLHSFQSEWLKKRRSLATWLVFGGALFTPLIVLASRIKSAGKTGVLYGAANFWEKLWHQSWESMSVLILPNVIVLATALVVQLEYKNNAWKQVHATPQKFATIYFAKLTVILILLLEVIALFNVGIYLSAVIPSLLFSTVPYPSAPIPYKYFLHENAKFFIDCLPIVALQYLVSLRFKNFLAPVGFGFIVWLLSIGMLAWQHSYVLPYVYSTLDFLISSGNRGARTVPVNLQLLALTYFVVFTIAGYILYATKKEKG